jgi:hypothetical protein
MAKDDKLQGTCSVCLRVMQLHGDRPIRHGFSAIGVQHGVQHGGYHTGPCAGTGFPHLGISTEGTQWALNNAIDRLAANERQLSELESYPDLIWYPRQRGSYNKVRGGLPDLTKPVTLRRGEDVPYAGDGRPTYDGEHKRRVTALLYVKADLERAIAAYEKVIATWSPEKYPVTGAAGKVETTHMATPRRNSRGEEWTGVLCRFTRSGYASDKLAKTTDPSKVTCKRCRDKLGLPPT